MSEDNKKTLPKDHDSDFSLPGRYEESNLGHFEEKIQDNFEGPGTPIRSSGKGILIGILVFSVFSAGFISFYLVNQDDIDSRIIKNTRPMSPDQQLAQQYGVGDYGSDHTHAALTVFVYGEQLNFGLSQFQLSSKYIHFENDNPYMIHKHATGVPLGMLFASFEMNVNTDCITLNYQVNDKTDIFCSEKNDSLSVYVNGEKYNSNISEYEINHNDRILISFGDGSAISEQLRYLESLKIFDVPKKIPQYSGRDINL